jgi:hypothetical protein
MKTLSLIMIFTIAGCSMKETLDKNRRTMDEVSKTKIEVTGGKDVFTVFHYNIKELDTKKVADQTNSQHGLVKGILKQYPIDILSLNEIQYDLPNVPNSNFHTKGENIAKLRDLFELDQLKYEAFYPANTGNNAIPKPDGSYYDNPGDPEARANADQVNFGTMPSQYSTGAMFKFPKVRETVITDLKWKDFNPNIDISKFAQADGKPLPEEMQLFDKNFTDAVLDINGKEVHLILLHTVPSFHFGNMKTPNYERNRDQLRFMEWYLTGSTDIKVNLSKIRPLKKDTYFIAVGDWNVAYDSTTQPGGAVLRSLFKKTKIWTKSENLLTFTNEGSGFEPDGMKLMLDYMVVSKNISVISGNIVHPNMKRYEAGCDRRPMQPRRGYVVKTYKKNRKTCYVYVPMEHVMYKQASDHYPLFGTFRLD